MKNRLAVRPLPLALVCVLWASLPGHGDDWPQWRGPLRDGVWREDGVLERFPPEGPPVRWRTAIGAGFSGPAIAGGRVFLMDRAVEEGASAGVKIRWDYRDKTQGQERVLCLDEATGKVLWRHAYPCAYETAYGFGPRATPTVCGDRVYALGAMGDLWCLESTRLRRRRRVPVQLRRPEGQHEMSQPLATMAMIPTGRPTRGGGRFRRER